VDAAGGGGRRRDDSLDLATMILRPHDFSPLFSTGTYRL
jgi:hypothetical protein